MPAAALAILMIGFLVGPRVPESRQSEFCVVNVRIAGPFGVSLNCDSPEFLRLAREPSALLEPENTRQSRPGLIIAAAIIALPLSPLADLAQKAGIRAARPDIEPGRIENSLAKDFPGYAAYVGLNAGIVLLSFYIFQLVCGRSGRETQSGVILAAVCSLLAANDVVKAFIWSPHTQMFNIFVPVFAVWASVRASEGALFDWRFALLAGAITGLGVTAYPLFFVVTPCVLASGVVALIFHWSRVRLWVVALNAFLLVVLTALPEGFWYLFVRYKTGGFYQHEMAGGQVVWLITAWQQRGFSHLLAIWLEKFSQLLSLAAHQAAAIAALLIVVAAAGILDWARVSAELRLRYPTFLCAILVAIVVASFYATTGLIAWRLAYAILPPLLVLAGGAVLTIAKTLPDNRRKVLVCACIAITLMQSVLVIVKSGPFS